ncbi:MAG: NYN domain-containing protein, partial [Pseudonocardiaceae bacterium]
MAAPLSGRGRLYGGPFFVFAEGWTDRCAVLVDAGYLYAEGGKLCCGTRGRGRSALKPSFAVVLLQKVALETTKLPVLRTYWYDGARHSIRTQEQREVVGLLNVKLRLGRLNANNEQKGVDALIYRELMTLAQNRAVSDAVLLSGDGDLCEGVWAAQDHGVRVVLVGIACVRGHNQSEELVLDADHLVVLSKPQLEPMFTSRSPVATGHAGVAICRVVVLSEVGLTVMSGKADPHGADVTVSETPGKDHRGMRRCRYRQLLPQT